MVVRAVLTACWVAPLGPSQVAAMASPFFYERLPEEIRTQLRLGVHLFQPAIFILQLLQPGHQRHVHPAKFGAPLVKRRVANAVGPADLRDRDPRLGVLQYCQNMAVGKP